MDPDTPQAIDVSSARLRIWNGNTTYYDERADRANNASDGIEFTVENLPKGPVFIQTWFYNASGAANGAVYYNYARADVIDVWGCMEVGNPNYNSEATVNNPDDCIVTTGVGLPNLNKNIRFSGNKLHFDQDQPHSIEVFNLKGDLVKKVNGKGIKVYDLAELIPFGVYVIKVNSKNITINKRWVKI